MCQTFVSAAACATAAFLASSTAALLTDSSFEDSDSCTWNVNHGRSLCMAEAIGWSSDLNGFFNLLELSHNGFKTGQISN